MIENVLVIVKNELITNTNVCSAEAIVLLVNVPKLEVKIPTSEATAPTSTTPSCPGKNQRKQSRENYRGIRERTAQQQTAIIALHAL